MGFKSFFSELKRRNIYKVAVVYMITGWVLVQIASVAANTFGAPPWVMKMIITVILLGFPITLVITWAFEVTPEGIAPTKTKNNSSTHNNRYFWGGTSLIAVLLLGGWWFLNSSPSERQNEVQKAIKDRSIAVLPFSNLGGEGKAEPLARGIHDDLLTRLSNISDFRVISRTSVEKYRDTNLDIPAIADSLDVRWILEGGVLEMGNQVKVNAQLINPINDNHLWANDYQRKLTAENFFAIQGEITRDIANALKAELTPSEQRRIAGAPTNNLEAYQLYVEGRSNLNTRTEEGMNKAVRYFKKAIEKDSTYALAWSGLADAVLLFRNKAYASPQDPLPDPEKIAKRALKLNPNLAEAHASMGFYFFRKNNAPAALQNLQKAINLSPSYAQAHHWLGFLLLGIGHPKEALKHLRLATSLNPKHYAAQEVLIQCLIANQMYEDALAKHKKMKELYPEPRGLSENIIEIIIYLHLKEYYKAISVIDKVRESSSQPPLWSIEFEATAYLGQGDSLKYKHALREFKKRNTKKSLFLNLATGNIDTAWRQLDQLHSDETYIMSQIIRYMYPDLLKDFREDPRYESFIQELNKKWGLQPDGSIPEKI